MSPGPTIIIRPPGRDPYALSLERLIEHVRAAKEIRRMGRMSKLFDRASNAVADLELHTEKSVTDFVARVEKTKERTDAVMLKKHQHIDGHMTDLAEFEKDLEAFDGKNEPSDAGESTEQAASWEPKT